MGVDSTCIRLPLGVSSVNINHLQSAKLLDDINAYCFMWQTS